MGSLKGAHAETKALANIAVIADELDLEYRRIVPGVELRRVARDNGADLRDDEIKSFVASDIMAEAIDAEGNTTTSGITPEEHRQMAAWPDGPQLFDHLRDLPGPLTLGETRDYVRSLGLCTDLLPSEPSSRPCRERRCGNRGVHVGDFFLADKAGGQEFTDEDEEVLVLFASQAATAIANARTYRREQRARADLEALVETTPVGVVVFDARTGRGVEGARQDGLGGMLDGLGNGAPGFGRGGDAAHSVQVRGRLTF